MIAGGLPPALETVGGRMAIYKVSDVELRLLKRVGGCLVASGAESVNLPLLENVGGNLVAETAKRLDASSLVIVDGDFTAPCATSIRARCLSRVKGNMNTLSAKGFYHSSIMVGGEWTCCPGAVEERAAAERAKVILRERVKDVYLSF